MNPRELLFLALAVVLGVFVLAFTYEFVLEDLLGALIYGAEAYRVEEARERWEYVLSATAFAALALLLPLRAALRLARERRRFEDELRQLNRRLEARIAERTRVLEGELAERRRVEGALRASEERFRDFAETAADWFWEMDAELRFTTVAGRYREMQGVSPEQVLGLEGGLRIEAQRADPRAWERLLRDLEAWQPYRDAEFLWERPGSAPRLLRSAGKPVLDPGGRVCGYRGSARDITAQRSAEQELNAARQAAEAASASKSQFLAHMSHEVRTPLGSMLGLLEILERTVPEKEQGRLVKMARSSGRLLLSLINDVLDISRIEAGRLRLQSVDFDLRGVIDTVLELFALEARTRGLELDAVIEPGLPARLRGDPGRLKQILCNLVGNAVKFTERGSVQVRVGLAERRAEAWHLRFEVQDTGIGIAPGLCAEIFESYVQVPDADAGAGERGGCGLGLAIARQLTELMGGNIACRSEPGAGSTFTFTVGLAPCAAEPGERVACEQGVEPGVFFARVLLAEDNPVNEWVATSMLQGLGCRVDRARNGEQVLAALERGRYDLVLMDCEMPVMDGFAATRRIRDRERAQGAPRPTPIVALTAHALEGFKERCMAAGMDDYLAKPFTEAELAMVLGRWLAPPQVPARQAGNGSRAG